MSTTYAICTLSTAALRRSPSQRAELVSQLLFGETVEVLEWRGRQWARVRCCADELEAFVAGNQIEPITEDEYLRCRYEFSYVLDLFQPIVGENSFVPVTIGARLPGFDGLRFRLGTQSFTFSGQAVAPADLPLTAELVLRIARKLLNAPFLWGGRSPLGLDAPALVQLAFGIVGYRLPRTTEAQVQCGRTVHFIEQSAPGDVAFFENAAGRVAHAGLLLPDHQILHVDEKVRIDAIDHYGIYNNDLGRYTHRLRIVKRLLNDPRTAPPAAPLRAEAEEAPQMALF